MKPAQFFFLASLTVLSCLNAYGQQKPEIKVKWIDTTATSQAVVQPYAYMEQMPSYPGGIIAIQKAIKAKFGNITVEKPGIEPTRIFVQFTVNEKGEIVDPVFLKSKRLKQSNPELDAQVFEFLKSMPKWIPGRQNGKPASVMFTYPFIFWVEEKQLTK